LTCGKCNDIDAKHKQKSAILPMRELAKDKLFILWLKDLPHGERFLPYGEKNLSPCRNLYRTRTRLGMKWQTLYFLTNKMKSKFLKLKILKRMIRKFPAIQ
jgi:hypothetical protein